MLNIFLITFFVRVNSQFKQYHIDPSGFSRYHDLNKVINKKSGNIKRIILFGDSRILQWNPLPELPECEFINRGMGGETTAQSLLRIERDCINLKPGIAVIATGINDCNSIGVLPDREKFIITSCKDNIHKMVNMLNEKKIKTVLLTIFPAGKVYPHRLPFWSDKTRDAINEINGFIMGLHSSNTIIINCDTIFLEGDKMKNEFSRDLLHINADGYVKLNEHVTPYLTKSIKEIR